MIKKKLLALGISAAAVTAVVGAGVAGWTFVKDAEFDQNLGINITAAESTTGTIAVANAQPDTVVLDQSGVTLAKSGALDTAISDIAATWTVATEYYDGAANDADTDIKYAANVYIKDGLATYVDCGTVVAETTSDRTGYTKYVFEITPAAGDVTTSGTDTVVTLKLANPFGYTEAKPGTFVKYQAMVAAIKGTAADSVAEGTAYAVASTSALIVVQFTVSITAA